MWNYKEEVMKKCLSEMEIICQSFVINAIWENKAD